MARPFKQGLQYFPLDVNIFEDEKIQDLNLAFGYLGEIIYIRLLSMIYANGYYLEKSISSLARTLMKSIGANWTPKRRCDHIKIDSKTVHFIYQTKKEYRSRQILVIG